MPLVSRLDRAILRELRGPLALGIVGFTLVMLMNALFVFIRESLRLHPPPYVFFSYLLLMLPRTMLFTVPMGVLLAVMVGIGRLATQNEMIALRSATVPLTRVFRPVFFVAVVLCLLSVASAEFLTPGGRARERQLMSDTLKVQDVNREIDPGIFYDRLPGAVLYAKHVAQSPQGRLFEGILLYRDSADNGAVDLIVAKRGRAALDRTTGQRSLLLDDGEWHTYRPSDPTHYQILTFEHNTIPFPPDAMYQSLIGADALRDDPYSMPMGVLWDYLKEKQTRLRTATEPGQKIAAQAQARVAGMEWHRRLSLPVAIVGMALVAFPLAARSRRGGRFAGLSQSIVLILVFYLALNFGWSLSQYGRVPPWLGPWLPNVVAFAWAAVLWIRLPYAERGAEPLPLRDRLADLRARFRRRAPEPAGAATGAARATDHSPAAASPPRRVVRRIAPERLDIFLASGYLKMFGAVLLVLYVLALAFAFRGVIEEVDPQAKAFPLADALRYLVLSTPSQLRFMVPMATLFGASISLSALARRGEITALKASGIGPVRMALPILSISLVIAGAYGLLQESFLPTAERESRRALDRVRGKVAGPEILETGRRWIAGDGGNVWNYVDWDARRGALLTPEVVTVDFDNARILSRVMAREARQTPTGWVFTSGWRREFPKDSDIRFQPLTEYPAPFYRESAELFGEARSRLLLGSALTDQLSFKGLLKNLRRSAQAGYPAAPIVVGLNEKLVFPLLPVLLVLVGVPLSVSGWQRKGSLYGFGISLLVIFLFWVGHAIFTGLGREGVMNPWVAAWATTVALAGFGTTLLARAR